MENSPAPAKKRGCFFYGCVTCLVIIVVVGLVGFLAVRYGLNRLNATIAEYTDDHPMTLPKVEMSKAEMEALHHRLDAFNDAIKAHSNAPPLVLNAREVNALLENTPEMNGFTNSFYVDIESNQIKGSISLPMERFFTIPLVHTKGRFLNGTGTFNFAKSNDTVFVNVQSLEVKGQPLPQQYLSQLRTANLAENFNKNSTNRAVLADYDSIVVSNNSVIIEPKKP
jgi:hypothetical protein